MTSGLGGGEGSGGNRPERRPRDQDRRRADSASRASALLLSNPTRDHLRDWYQSDKSSRPLGRETVHMHTIPFHNR